MAKRIIKRAVSIVMLNGDAAGVLEVTIPGSQSMAYKIPRSELGNCKILGVNDFNSVYFLFGDIGKAKPVVYIGQAGIRNNGGAILTRLAEHDKKKDFWTEAIVFTNTNDMFGPTELNFLENQFCSMAMGAGRYDVKNGNNPNQGNIKRREAELEPYVYDAETLLNILGYKIFDALEEESIIEENEIVESECVDAVNIDIPELDRSITKVGDFIRSAMTRLYEAGYVFSKEQLEILTDWEKCKEIFNLQSGENVPFFKKYDSEERKPHHVNGVQRYYTPKNVLFHFGDADYMLTKEWYDKYHHREYFINWYESLKTAQ